jgi:L-threonylcarbamoyladenylate synthase
MAAHEELLHAAELIRAGRLVAFPTETVYGLGANALDPQAVERIFAAKGRPATSPLIVHVNSEEMARSVVREWPPHASELARLFWPGPLTLVLPKAASVPDRVTAGLGTVAIRMPRHPVALELISLAGVPLAAPSANRFTGLSPTTADHVRDALGDAVDLVIDGGPSEVGIESTVLSLAGDPVLLRPGMVSRDQIEAVVGPLGAAGTPVSAHPSPGMHARHYSPSTRLAITTEPPPGRCVYVWWHEERPARGSVRLPADPEGYAHSLYATLHALDGEGWETIAVEPVPESPEWAGIRDRLRRAASS